MAFTASDLAQVEAAILAVAAGGVYEIEDSFGNKTRYSDLNQLLKVKDTMEKDIANAGRSSGMEKHKFVAKT